MAILEGRYNLTIFGSTHARNCTIGITGKQGRATGLILVAPNGDEWVLWITNAGVITISDYATFYAAVS
jgi:hypothetical protein